MSGQEVKAPPLRFRMSPAESAEGVRLSSNAEGMVQTPTAPWERKRLGEMSGQWFKGQAFSRNQITDNGKYTCVHYGELFTHYGAVTDDVVSRTDEKPLVSSKIGDVLFPASDVTPDGLGRCTTLLKEGVLLGGDIIGFRQLECDSAFLSYAVNNAKQQIIRLVSGTTVRHSSASRLACVTVAYPPSATEQRCIGTFFRSLDALIVGREKALEKLEAMKKSMSLKMFPQGDAKVPEVRFKGFAGEWEKSSFDEVFIHIPSKAFQIQSTDYRECGQFPVVDQGKVRIIGYTDNAGKVFKAKDNPVIVFGDHTREVKFVDFDFVVGADGTQLLRTPENDIQFMSYVVQSTPLPNMGYSRHFKFLQEATFLVPKLPEQQKIGAYFRSLDALIASRREEVEKLKQMKKALLERMFV